MPAYRVAWQQPAQVTATVTVDLDELAQWAVDSGGVRALASGDPVAADLPGLRRLLERNQHFREELLRRWAIDHLPHS